MEHIAEQLLSEKSDRLLEYLGVTQTLCKKINKRKSSVKEEVELAGDERFISAIEECVTKRASLVNKINEIDSLLKNKLARGYVYTRSEENKKWLCDKLAKDIAEVEKQNSGEMNAVFEAVMSKLGDSKRSLKTISAYGFIGAKRTHSKEWTK